MNFWIYFWSAFFFISLALFIILAAVVLVGGFLNIKSLFRSLSRQESDTNEADKTGKLP